MTSIMVAGFSFTMLPYAIICLLYYTKSLNCETHTVPYTVITFFRFGFQIYFHYITFVLASHLVLSILLYTTSYQRNFEPKWFLSSELISFQLRLVQINLISQGTNFVQTLYKLCTTKTLP